MSVPQRKKGTIIGHSLPSCYAERGKSPGQGCFPSVSGGRGSVEGFRKAEPVQPRDLALEIKFWVSRVVAVLGRNDSIDVREFLADQLVGVREDKESVMFYLVVTGFH